MLSATSGRPRTRSEQKHLQNKEDIHGWFSLPRGHPPKRKSEVCDSEPSANTDNVVGDDGKKSCQCKPRVAYKSWCTGENQDIPQAHLSRDKWNVVEVPIAIIRSTLHSVEQRTVKKVTRVMTTSILLSDGRAEKCLTNEDDQREIAEIICCWDMNNYGISRSDAITLIMDWTCCNDCVKAKNDFAYLVQKKSFQT
jgi:hypothetical protein